MHPAIQIRRESKRGCGWRKAGGIYLCCDALAKPCGKLPVELKVCPVCHAGIKPSRGWTWIDPRPFIKEGPCHLYATQGARDRPCYHCLLYEPPERAGLLWIGEKFYSYPEDWLKEAQHMGVSRRIPAVPKDFVVGKTLVLAAHRKVVLKRLDATVGEPDLTGSAIFSAFRPSRIEYVVKGDESDEEIEKLLKRGFTLVKIERNGEQMKLEKAS